MKKRDHAIILGIMLVTMLCGCGERRSILSACETAEIDRDQSIYETAESDSEEKRAARECLRYMAGEEGKLADYHKAAETIAPYKDSKDPDVLYCLGVMHDWYMEMEFDVVLARELLEEAEKGGNYYASVYLGVMYENGTTEIDRDYEVARDYYRRAILNGVVEGYLGLGRLYANGHGMKQDGDKAYEYFQKVINEGSDPFYITWSIREIGDMYYNGIRRDSSNKEADPEYGNAMKWYEKAMNAGSLEGAEALGYLYLDGEGCRKDSGKALEYLEKAANGGDPSCMRNLGWIYLTGEDVEHDWQKALEWFDKAAEYNDPYALFSIGQMYDGGLGGADKDEKKAKEYYDKAYAAGYEG